MTLFRSTAAFLQQHMLPGLTLVALAGLTACSTPPPAPVSTDTPTAAPAAEPAAPAPVVAAAPPAPPPPAPAGPPPILPFDEAVLSAANNVLGKAQLPAAGTFNVVIDPLIDGVTGAQTATTHAMGARLTKLIQDSYPRYAVQPFNAATVQQGPLILIGTFTGVNADRKTEGKRESFRICFALADLRTGKLVSKGLAFAQADGVDSTPLPFFRDSPVWLDDPATTGYIRTCQGTRAGDPINPNYLDRVVTAATIAEAIDAYAKNQFADALKLYETALASPGGNQLRVHTGLYLTNLKLRRMDAARKAFGELIEQGLDNKRLGVKFLFRPGTAALWIDPKAGPLPYPMWLGEIATRTAKRPTCLELGGHTSASGTEPLNERLSLLRADSVMKSIRAVSPAMGKRMETKGYGSAMMLVGTGRDDLSDALDRRVELLVKDCN
jgi:hypothetical protein